jgi:hypothetical protein
MDVITNLYNNRGYLDIHAMDVLITICIFLVTIVITGYVNYQSMLMAIRADWDVYRCNPLVMPFTGVVMPVEGKSNSSLTMENFQYCLKRDTAISLSIATMPLEFLMYTTVEFLDGLQEGVNMSMNITQWILNKVLEERDKIFNQLKQVVVPLQEILTYIRDSIAKGNAVMTTSLYVVMNMYNLIISGTINVMKVLSNMIIIWTVAMLIVAAIAFALIATGIGAAAGIPMYASAVATLVTTIVPGIVMYAMMRTLITAISSVAVDKPPPKPTLKKKKKK